MDTIKEIFSQQFVPRTGKCKYLREVHQMEQGDLSVFKYVKRVNKLLMYAPLMFQIEREMIKIFVYRLHRDIRLFVTNTESTGIFPNVYNQALFVEESL